MRKPSGRMMRSKATVYKFRPTQGANAPGGSGANYYPDPPYASDVRCSAQIKLAPRQYDGQWIVGGQTYYEGHFHFDDNLGFALNDRIDWVDKAGNTHTFYVWEVGDNTHNGGLCKVDAQERQAPV